MSSTPPVQKGEAVDHASRWRLAQSDDPTTAAVAFEELANRFWYPVYAWWRATGFASEEAAAATESCFARWLESEPPRLDDAGASRLREWLAARLALMAESGVEAASNPALVIDRELAAQRFTKEQPLEPAALFRRRWALTVLEGTIGALRAEYAAAGREAMVPLLMPSLGFSSHSGEQSAQGAQAAKMTEGAFRLAVFEFRKRYRELLLANIGDTVADAAEIGDEMAALLCASS